MSEFVNLNQDNFTETVFTSNKPTFVQFSANWCGVCKHIQPIMDQLLDQFKDSINFVKVDVEENMELAESFNINALPSFLIVDKHEVKEQVIGAKTFMEFANLLYDTINK